MQSYSAALPGYGPHDARTVKILSTEKCNNNSRKSSTQEEIPTQGGEEE